MRGVPPAGLAVKVTSCHCSATLRIKNSNWQNRIGYEIKVFDDGNVAVHTTAPL
jgi:hypothetical protein